MTAPGTAAGRFLWACLLGVLLGILYGFLRPLRPKRTALADGIFLAAALWIWVWLNFQICRGDIRLGYTVGLFAGGLIWEWGVGWLLRPIFGGFWKHIGRIIRILSFPLKKILDFSKIMFASGEKWVTIKWNNRRHNRRRPGGVPYGRKKYHNRQISADVSPQQANDQDHRDRGYFVFYAGSDCDELGTQQYS